LGTIYNIDFASCVGSLIYLGMTRTDIAYAVNKLAKYANLEKNTSKHYFTYCDIYVTTATRGVKA
jgi:uncharacterized hydantoinase/oxoprolinase family protein